MATWTTEASGAEVGTRAGDISRAFSEAEPDPPRLLGVVTDAIGGLFGEACVVRVRPGDGEALSPATVFHPDPRVRDAMRRSPASRERAVSEGAWGAIVAHGAEVRDSVVVPLDGAGEWAADLPEGPVQRLGVPLVSRGRAIGGVVVLRYGSDEAYTADDLALLREVACRAAIALDNAMLADAARSARARAAEADAALHQERDERLRAEAALRGSDTRFRNLLEEIHEHAIYLLNRDGRVLSWNPAAERITGWRSEQVIGEPFAMLHTEADRRAGIPARDLEATRNAGRIEQEGWRLHSDGSTWWGRHVLIACVEERGEHVGFMGVSRDLTEMRASVGLRRLNQLLEARTAELIAANEELEAFASSISHDLRAPLRTVAGLSEALLFNGNGLDDITRDDLRRIRGAVARMRQLIEDLLTLSRVTGGILYRAEVDLVPIADECMQELRAREPGRAVEWVAAPRAPVFGDARLLRIVLENLLGNAWKFTRRVSEPRIELDWEGTVEATTVTVRDNGAGFDPEATARLFRPFQRLHGAHEFEGTGVGLAIVRRIVHRHGGRVSAEGAIGRGASFRVELPAIAAPQEDEHA